MTYEFNPNKLSQMQTINPRPGLQIDIELCRLEIFRLLHLVFGSEPIAKKVAQNSNRKIVQMEASFRKRISTEYAENLTAKFFEIEAHRILLFIAIQLRTIDDSFRKEKFGTMVGVADLAELKNTFEKVAESFSRKSGPMGLLFTQNYLHQTSADFRTCLNKIVHCNSFLMYGSKISSEGEESGVNFFGPYANLKGTLNKAEWVLDLDIWNFLSTASICLDAHEEHAHAWYQATKL